MQKALTGYGRPPVDHQFKAGQSGNPAGRPKNARFSSDLRAELGETCSVSDGAKLVEVTKQRALVKTLVQKAIKGDLRAIATIVGACAAVSDNREIDDEAEAPEDMAILKATAVAPPKRRPPTSRVNGGET
jgi:hypothetical protein